MVTNHNDLRGILDQDYQASTHSPAAPRAAVAAIFRRNDGRADNGGRAASNDRADNANAGSELLFIQRATKPTDPWSGQMAFPGGRSEERDSSPQDTAMRETMEEIGLHLAPSAYVGSLNELDGGRANGRHIIVSAHAYWLEGPRPDVNPNHEVADVVWVPLNDLGDTDRYIDYHYPLAGADFPGIQLDQDGQVIWGLTLRLLSDLFHRMSTPFIIPYED
jgi:8-oxo-dGTP pyrophosphatase MutT (NUDIX family)